MDIKLDPAQIWEEYQKLVEYLTQEKIFKIVEKNERFFQGKQWEGLDDDADIAKPTMDNLQRIGKYQIAMITSNDVGISIKSLTGNKEDDQLLSVLSKEAKDVIEQAKIIETARLVVRDGFVAGANYMHQSFDPFFETGQDAKGRIENEQVDVRRMFFGNPYSADIQKQPYIIIALRQYVDQVREEAEELGVQNVEDIKPDADENYDDDSGDKLVTVLLKYFKKKKTIQVPKITIDEFGNEIEIMEEKTIKTVHFVKCTKDVMIKEDTDLGYTRYPISRFGWDNRNNSYIYDTPMTWNIVNQVFVNKCYAYMHEYAFKSAFPKRIYDQTKIDIEDFDSDEDMGVAGIDMLGKFLDFSKMPDFSNQVIDLVKLTESEMEKNMGVNDAALGNVKPDNAQAIIALQESASVPLEIQRQNFYEMWEDTIRNIIDIMIASYGERKMYDDDDQPVVIDFSKLQGFNYKLNIDIGSSAQYSEIAQMNTINSLLSNGLIDLETFLNVCPDKYIPMKSEIKKFAEEQKQKAAQQSQNPDQMM